jgi:hypothetical protein
MPLSDGGNGYVICKGVGGGDTKFFFVTVINVTDISINIITYLISVHLHFLRLIND